MMKLHPAPHTLSYNAFLEEFGGIYEHSPWVASSVFNAGLSADDADPAHIASRMAAVVTAADRPQQLALLRAHPQLAGKLALAGTLTASSTAEQAGAGLDQCSQVELDEFQALNDRYTEKYGHPFIIAVRGLDRGQILAAFRQRVSNNTDSEFITAMAEVHKIGLMRLNQLAADAC